MADAERPYAGKAERATGRGHEYLTDSRVRRGFSHGGPGQVKVGGDVLGRQRGTKPGVAQSGTPRVMSGRVALIYEPSTGGGHEYHYERDQVGPKGPPTTVVVQGDGVGLVGSRCAIAAIGEYHRLPGPEAEGTGQRKRCQRRYAARLRRSGDNCRILVAAGRAVAQVRYGLRRPPGSRGGSSRADSRPARCQHFAKERLCLLRQHDRRLPRRSAAAAVASRAKGQ
jgi:hypothetical protein